MTGEQKAIVAVVAIIFGTIVIGASSEVGKARANAVKACYEAAKVNQNIRCEATHE